ncbi:MAG: hypothetical protein KatS3mg057_2669 [Herpetosiphonaceae bacterium]|nr:MAG: hypothetical protein KatS3mg057_2669 [Herpetosiphonaceae bacterium]
MKSTLAYEGTEGSDCARLALIIRELDRITVVRRAPLSLGLMRVVFPVYPLFLYGANHDEQVMMGGMSLRIRQLQELPLRLDVPQVIYAPGDRFCKNSGSYRIGFTMLEVDRLPPSWVEQANQMDEIWTPTEWGAEVFRASGITPADLCGTAGRRYHALLPSATPRTTWLIGRSFSQCLSGARAKAGIFLRALLLGLPP